MKRACSYCHEYFDSYEGDKNRYCSEECHQLYLARQRMNYSGKRETVCRQCGKELPKNKTRFCSRDCSTRYNHIKSGAVNHSDILTKQCPVCGKEFQTWKSRQLTCSSECSKVYHNRSRTKTEEQKQRRKEYDRQKWLRLHPDASTAEEIHERKLAREAEKELKRKEREAELQKIRAHKEAIKQANIDYWLNYEAEHECEVCGEKFLAHYPTAKYCSKTCQKKNTRTRDRYKGITIDKGITLPRLAKRDHNQCQICGLFVDWDDFIQTDKTKICGDMYPSIDHIRPISLGGVHSWDNVQLAHRKCNSRKQNKYIG